MNTQFISKSIAPSRQQLGPIERWFYNLINMALMGGATAVTSSIGLVIVHGAGVQDVPQVNLHIMGTIFLGGALGKLMFFLAQGLPSLQPDNPPQQEPESTDSKP